MALIINKTFNCYWLLCHE